MGYLNSGRGWAGGKVVHRERFARKGTPNGGGEGALRMVLVSRSSL